MDRSEELERVRQERVKLEQQQYISNEIDREKERIAQLRKESMPPEKEGIISRVFKSLLKLLDVITKPGPGDGVGVNVPTTKKRYKKQTKSSRRVKLSDIAEDIDNRPPDYDILNVKKIIK